MSVKVRSLWALVSGLVIRNNQLRWIVIAVSGLPHGSISITENWISFSENLNKTTIIKNKI